MEKYFLYNSALLGFVVLTLVFWKMKGKEWAVCKGEKIDIIGDFSLCSYAWIEFLDGFSNITGTIGKFMVILGILAFIILLCSELRVEHPVLEG